MNYNRFIKLYKGVFLVKLSKRLKELKNKGIIDFTIDVKDLDHIIKIKSGFNPLFSCSEMDYNDFMELSINCFELGDQIGVFLNFPDNDFHFQIK